MELFQVQLSKATLTHFTSLATRKLEFPNLDSTNYQTSVQKLCDELAKRLTDLIQNEIKLKLLAQPFDLVVEDCPDDLQMELIELQADMETKRKYSENSLVDFYKIYVCEKYPNLSPHAKRMTFFVGSMNCCEQFFSKNEAHQKQIEKSLER